MDEDDRQEEGRDGEGPDEKSQDEKDLDEDDQKEVINNPRAAGLEGGFLRPKFRHDAPRWFTILIFAFFIGLLIFAFLPR